MAGLPGDRVDPPAEGHRPEVVGAEQHRRGRVPPGGGVVQVQDVMQVHVVAREVEPAEVVELPPDDRRPPAGQGGRERGHRRVRVRIDVVPPHLIRPVHLRVGARLRAVVAADEVDVVPVHGHADVGVRPRHVGDPRPGIGGRVVHVRPHDRPLAVSVLGEPAEHVDLPVDRRGQRLGPVKRAGGLVRPLDLGEFGRRRARRGSRRGRWRRAGGRRRCRRRGLNGRHVRRRQPRDRP